MKTSLRRLARIIAITFAVGYLGVIGVLAYWENRFVYHPRPAAHGWSDRPVPEIQEVELSSADGNRLGAWWLPCPDSERSLLYLHGNAGNLSDRGDSILKIRKHLDTSVLIVDYPGYGKSTGRPSEKGCYLAADAAYEYLIAELKRDPKQLLLFGGSLGGAVALDLAKRKPHGAVIILKSFTSAPDIGSRWFPWAPVRWIMRNQFSGVEKSKTFTPRSLSLMATRTASFPLHMANNCSEPPMSPKLFYDWPITTTTIHFRASFLLNCVSSWRSMRFGSGGIVPLSVFLSRGWHRKFDYPAPAVLEKIVKCCLVRLLSQAVAAPHSS